LTDNIESSKIRKNASAVSYINFGIIMKNMRYANTRGGEIHSGIILLITQSYFAGFDEESKREIMRKVTEL
jgi:hypothetical protein